jgi:transposase
VIRPGEAVEVYLCREPVDMRRGVSGLSAQVEQGLGLDPFAKRLFVFCSRRRDKIKILYWERSGFVLWYKRLEKARFAWPEREGKEPVLAMTGRELNWLLDGIDLFRVRPHEELRFDSVL